MMRPTAPRRFVRHFSKFVSDKGRFPAFVPSPHLAEPPAPPAERMTAKHNVPWSPDEVDEALKKNSIYQWGATDPIRAACPVAERVDGVYIYDNRGNKFLDFSAGAVCTNLGNTMPEEIKKAANDSMDKMGFVYGDLYSTEVRARLCTLLADVTPGDINGFLLASSGAEANEAAIRMARAYTGRFKVMTRARSYHGGTTTTLAATGDPRSWAVSNSSLGMLKIPDPFPFTFDWGPDEATRTHLSLSALHEQILNEGPNQIACILMESFTGANGWLQPGDEYMQGVRALCDKYGILLIFDEVMTGFGRTGTMFGFEHFPGVLPDMITFAKGVTSAYVPLSGVGCRDHIFDHFRTNPIGYGSTYSAHPLPCAIAEAVIKYTLKHDIIGNVQKMSPIMSAELLKLADKHPSVKAARCVGLAGGLDLAGKDGNFLMDMHEAHAGLAHLKNTLRELGLITLIRGHFLHVTPPLTINEEQIHEGIAILDEGLTALDAFIAKSD